MLSDQTGHTLNNQDCLIKEKSFSIYLLCATIYDISLSGLPKLQLLSMPIHVCGNYAVNFKIMSPSKYYIPVCFVFAIPQEASNTHFSALNAILHT